MTLMAEYCHRTLHGKAASAPLHQVTSKGQTEKSDTVCCHRILCLVYINPRNTFSLFHGRYFDVTVGKAHE